MNSPRSPDTKKRPKPKGSDRFSSHSIYVNPEAFKISSFLLWTDVSY